MNPSASARASDPWPRFIAWTAVVGSTVPEIIWQESGHRVSFLFVALESLIIAAAGVAALAFPRLRGLTRFLLAVAALNFAWSFVAPALARSDFVRSLSDNASWGARLFIGRTMTLSGAVLASLTLIRSRLTRRDLFLCVGNLSAPAQPIPFLGLRRPVPWTWLGPCVILVFALVLSPFLYFTVHPNFGASSRILRFLSWMVVVAVLNAARHANANTIRVTLESDRHRISIQVADDGRGFPFVGSYDLATLNTLGSGPLTLKERVAELGGDLRIRSGPSGADVRITVPFAHAVS